MTTVSERLGNWFPVLLAAGIPLFFLPGLVDAFILPRAALVIGGACVGGGLALMMPNRPGLGNIRTPLVAAAAAALLAFAFSVSWPLSLIGGYTRYESLPMRLAYLGLFAAPVWLLRTRLARTAVIVAVVAGVAISSLEAVVQWLSQVPYRPDGNLGNANLLGALVAMALPLAARQILRRHWSIPIWLLAAACMVGGLIASTSRSGAVGALAGCAALAVFALRGRAAAIAGLAGAVIVVGAVLLVLFSPLSTLNGDPGAARQHLYPDALHMVAARPLTGWGEDTTGLVFGRFLSGDWAQGVTFDRAHSELLDVGATQGVAGLAAFAWFTVVLYRGFWRWRSEVAAIAAACTGYLVWVMFNFDWAPATGVFWLLAGTGWSAVRAAETVAGGEPGAVSWSTRLRVQRLVGALGLVAVAIVFAALPVLAEAWYSMGRPDLAVQADPLQVQYRRSLGEALVAQGARAEGIDQLRLAARLGATDPALYVELGDAELRAGDVAQARRDYETALQIDPYWAPAQQRLAGRGGVGRA